MRDDSSEQRSGVDACAVLQPTNSGVQMNHKRKRPKNRRSGCLLCKPHKANGVDDATRQELLARIDEREQRKQCDHAQGQQ
jgi:hypothetical protein